MHNNTQLERYKKLLDFIDENFKEDIDIPKIEAICHYSYRNINRIFEALHQETIGKYIKRLRLEKAAEYLKYSEIGVADIAYEVGFEDRAAFSKAFKKKYGFSPSAFRDSTESLQEKVTQSLLKALGRDRNKLQYEITYLPDFKYLFLEYRGSYENILAIEEASKELYTYAIEKEILNKRSIFMTEIMDDSEISDSIHLRYNLGFILEQALKFKPEGFYRVKKHKRQKYAKFIHEGTYQSYLEFHKKIYAFWMLDVALELEDLPTLEFYPNDDENNLPERIQTEIYIPIM